MGKVGSKTVVESLISSTLGRPIYHVHYITKEGLDYHKDMSLNSLRPKLGRPHWTGHYLRKKNLTGEKCMECYHAGQRAYSENCFRFLSCNK